MFARNLVLSTVLSAPKNESRSGFLPPLPISNICATLLVVNSIALGIISDNASLSCLLSALSFM